MKGRACDHLAFPISEDVRQQADENVECGKAFSVICYRKQQNAMPLKMDLQLFPANPNSRARVRRP